VKTSAWFVGSLLLVGADHWLKEWCSTHFILFGDTSLVGRWLTLTRILNGGVIGGNLAYLPPGYIEPFIRYWPSLILSLFIVLAFSWRWKPASILERSGLIFLVSGCISNLVDHWRSYYVLDTLKLKYWADSYIPFNLADVWILFGLSMFLTGLISSLPTWATEAQIPTAQTTTNSTQKTQLSFSARPEITDLLPIVSSMKQQNNWDLIIQADGILGYKKDVQGSDIHALKGFGEVNAPFERVASIIIDEDNASDWIEDLVVSKVVGGSFPADYIEYNHIETPFILNDREFVSRVRMKIDPAHKIVAYFYTPTDFSYPIHEPWVRGELTYSVIAVQAMPDAVTTKSIVYSEFQGDPKGNVPKWLVNWFQTSWPKDTLLSLRKEAAKSKVAVHPFIASAFAASSQPASQTFRQPTSSDSNPPDLKR